MNIKYAYTAALQKCNRQSGYGPLDMENGLPVNRGYFDATLLSY